ncbi:MAG TPA: ABC transporter ATP-binding protein [Candidatus Limnocylindria bacterium]|nr:ABC transporter ATP-binding protein [Candidatus Limnocylindria bacterium]
MTDTVLTLDRVSKRFGTLEVLRGVSLSLRPGECVALTGVNGSGKSTLLRISAGLTVPTSGAVIFRRGLRADYIPEGFPRLNLSARALLRSLSALEGGGRAFIDRRMEELLHAFSLAEAADTPIRTYSKGMLQKVAVIQAFMGSSDLLLMDEPLSGQDAQSQDVFIELAKGLLSEGMAVLLACHERGLVRALADRVFALRDGALHQADIPPEEGEDVYLFDAPDVDFGLPAGFGHGINVMRQGRVITVRVAHRTGDAMLTAMLQAGCRLRGMRHEADR